MQSFFRGLLVAAITYFLKLGHNNHGLIFTVVGPPTGRRNSEPSTGRRNSEPSTGRRNNGPSTGRVINGPYTGSMIDGHTWANNRPHYGRKRARVGIVRSWADHNGPSLIGHI